MQLIMRQPKMCMVEVTQVFIYAVNFLALECQLNVTIM